MEDNYQYLKISSVINENMLGYIINETLLEKQVKPDSDCMIDEVKLSLTILQLKLGTFRLGSTALFVFKISVDEIFVIYYSSNQL